MIETYTTKFSTRRWLVVLFCNLLDIAALNTYVLYEKFKADGASMGKRRLFIKELGKALCQELQEHRQSDAIHPGLARARQLYHSGTCKETWTLPRLSQTERQKGYSGVLGMQ